ncbi:YybS family protein [Paenibacillus thiaminolyticus]|uniref:DUF2232 domain-containing protein n=1 Tax=Paenibacillus thiaminolyticus TaxID=49283 RepID=UPI00232B65F9|nr:DUF2232 domain-containing protein [Paenibacillus thiaminolyticus]WCF08340.1 YybS family protein [Paenibacillus thiaminolyticus]WCR25839.1 YybS family protein [Paenibacillus thiaminolyticus]
MNRLKYRWSSLAWAVAALVLLLSILQPIMVLTMSLMAVPFVMLYATQSLRGFILHGAALLLIVYFLLGGFGMAGVLTGVYFMIPGIVFGHMFKQKRPALNVYVAGTATFLVESLLLLALAKLAFDFNVYQYIMSVMNESMVGLQQTSLFPADLTQEMKEQFVILLSQMIPFMLIIGALYMGTITYAISRALLTAQGIPVQKLKPVRQWMLPRALIWYYLITIILDLVVQKSSGSFLTLILINLVPLLQIAFMVQGIGFLFFLAHSRKWNKAIPVVITIAVIFLPVLHGILRIIGIVDLAFPLRQAMSKPKA